MTNENSNVINNQTDCSSQSSLIEPNILSPVNTKNLTINTSNDDLSSSLSLSSTSSITPESQQANENKSLKLKRPRDNSCDTQGSSNDLNVKDDNSRSSPVPPPCKAAKMGYSIMNILAKDKKDDNSSNKENNSDTSNSPPVSPREKQNNLTTTQTQQQQPINPFLLNPFLAAAAAAAQAGTINNSANQQAQINNLNPLLNNISNFALLTKQQNSADFWPWLNVAAMSALYGLDKGYPNLYPQSLENSQFLLQQHQQRNQSKSMFMFPQADLIQNNGRSTPNDSNNNQQNLHIGQMVNNILHNHHQHHHQHLENDNHKINEDSYNSTRSPIHHHNNSSSSASSSSSLNKTSTPHTNMNLNRFQVFNPQRQLNKNNENLLMNELKTARANNNNQGQISPPIHHQNRFISSESLINEAHSRKLLNKSFGAEDDDRDDVISSNNGGRHGLGGASLGDDDDLDDDNLEMGEDDDLDGSNNGDSFDNMRKKKTRTVFSRNQVFQLESTFDMKRYLSSSERSSLANSLQLTETQIKIWFQNRRNKWKRQLAAEIESNNGLPSQSSNQQHQQTTQLIQSNSNTSNSSNNSHRNSLTSTNSNTSSQRVIRVPVVYQSGETSNSGQRQNFMLQSDIEPGHLLPSSSTSSTHSSLTSPSNSANFNSAAAAAAAVLNNMATNSSQGQVNPTSLLSPSMLAAAAAASSLYYAAAASAPGQFSSLNLTNSSGQNLKQPLSSIL